MGDQAWSREVKGDKLSPCAVRRAALALILALARTLALNTEH